MISHRGVRVERVEYVGNVLGFTRGSFFFFLFFFSKGSRGCSQEGTRYLLSGLEIHSLRGDRNCNRWYGVRYAVSVPTGLPTNNIAHSGCLCMRLRSGSRRLSNLELEGVARCLPIGEFFHLDETSPSGVRWSSSSCHNSSNCTPGASITIFKLFSRIEANYFRQASSRKGLISGYFFHDSRGKMRASRRPYCDRANRFGSFREGWNVGWLRSGVEIKLTCHWFALLPFGFAVYEGSEIRSRITRKGDFGN